MGEDGQIKYYSTVLAYKKLDSGSSSACILISGVVGHLKSYLRYVVNALKSSCRYLVRTVTLAKNTSNSL